MENSLNVTQYFPGSITYKGFTSYWESNLDGIEQIYILKGGPGTGKSTFMQRITKIMQEQGYAAESMWCSSDARSMDGTVFRGPSLAMIDGTSPHMRDPKYPGVRDLIIDLGKYWRRDQLIAQREQIIKLTDRNKMMYRDVYDQLKKARDFEIRNQALYKVRIDEDKWLPWVEEFAKATISCCPATKEVDHHRWIRAVTPQGMVSYFSELQARAKTSHCLCTKARQFGSKTLELLAKHAAGKGAKIWYYHDPFEPDWLEAIYLPQLECLFFQSETAEDYQNCKNHELDQWYHAHINRRNNMESEFLLDAAVAARCKGQSLLKENKFIHDELEVYYIRAMDFDAMNQEKEVIIQEFLNGGGLK